jgi:iron complex outermembrane receptor protein
VNYDRTSAVWGIYGEGEFHLHPKLILDVGVRNDRYNYSFGSSTNPRAALIYTPRKATTLKFLYGTAFRAPSFSELYYEGMKNILGLQPTPLKPESIRTLEGVWEQHLSKRVTVSASGFYNHIGNYIEEQTVIINQTDAATFSNSKATAKGAELEVTGKLASGIESRLSYTYQDARNENAGSILQDSPKHLAKLNIADPLFHGRLTPAIEAQYMSRSLTIYPTLNPTPTTGYSAPPVLLNISVSSRPLWGGFSLSGGVYNLVGRSLSDPSAGYFEPTETTPREFYTVRSPSLLPDDRRSFRVKLTWTSGERGDKRKPNTQSEETH